ncbi:MAG TPA: S41 family peptidase, partial [Chthoniobacterales bacterium]
MKLLPFAGALLLPSLTLLAQQPSPTPAPTPAATPSPKPAGTPAPAADLVNQLNDTQLDQAVDLLKTQFLNPAALNDQELRRARLEGLLDRLGPGAHLYLESAKPAAAAPGRFLAEVLDSQVGYIRLGKLDADTLTQLDAVLAGFKEKSVHAVVLDLRSAGYNADYEQAAAFARRFCEKGRLLFRVRKPSAKQERIFTSNQDSVFTGKVVVLTDRQTAGAGEILAAVLRRQARAMIVGTSTAGQAVEFSEVPLGGGVTLKIAVSEATVPDAEAIYPRGVKPDILVALPADQQAEIFRQSAEKGVSQFVYERERPRMNEAALIANLNPEIDGSGGSAKNFDNPALKDTVLQRAVDLLTALSF